MSPHVLDQVTADRGAAPGGTPPPASEQVLSGGVVRDSSQGVRNRGGVSITQRILADAVSGSSQTVHVQVGGTEPVHFDLFAVHGSDASGVRLPEDVVLLGRTTVLRVQADLNRSSRASEPGAGASDYAQAAVKIGGEVELRLEVDPPALGATAALEGAEEAIDPERAVEWGFETRLTVPSDFGERWLRVRLLYRQRGSAGAADVASERRLRVVGTSEEARGKTRVLGVADPPEKTGILHIVPADGGRFSALCFLPGRGRTELTREQAAPLPDRIPAEGDALEYLGQAQRALSRFSRGHTGQLGKWFEQVLELYGDEATIVIVDGTDRGVPWELFTLSDGTRLGARARVVRWAEVQYRDEPLLLETARLSIRGDLAGFVDPEDRATTVGSLPAVAAASWHEDARDLDDALADASAAGRAIGLVYLSSHGVLTFGDEDDAALEPLGPWAGRRSEVYLEWEERSPARRPLFLADAPFAGRMLQKERRPCGLAHGLLLGIASGYLAPLGPVERTHALAVAARLMEAYRGGGLRPADALLELRREALLRAKTGSRAERDAALLPFLWVFYGNPELEVGAPREEDGDG